MPSAPSPLRLLSSRLLSGTQLELVLGTADGSPLDSNRVLKIEVRASNRLAAPLSTWPRLTNHFVLNTNGQARLTTMIDPGQPLQFYRAVEQP